MPALKKIRGFTLIELMIAISIVAVISAVGLVTYSQAQKLGRDAKRKQDIRSIASALELYYLKNKQFPQTGWVYSTSSQWIPGIDTNYMNTMPTDPKSNGGTPWVNDSFGYAYWANPCGSYTTNFYVLITQLENKTDPDRNEAKQYKWCDGVPLINYGWSPYSFIVTAP